MNGMFDLPNSGNYGLGGELTLIRKIKELSEDTVILVQNKEKSTYEIYQYASKAREFVHTNYQYLGSIENYDIYAKNIKNGEK